MELASNPTSFLVACKSSSLSLSNIIKYDVAKISIRRSTYPVVAAFRSLLVKNKVTGKYEWKNGVGPIDVWDNNKEDLVNKIMNFAASIGDNPNAVGKDSNIWDLAYMTIMLRNMP